MPRVSFLLLLCLALFTVACQKAQPTPTPEPDLLGQWNQTKRIVRHFDGNHNELDATTTDYTNSKYRTHILLKQDQMEYYFQDTLRLTYFYSRSGNTLYFATHASTILELTDHALTLSEVLNTTPQSSVTEHYYTR